MGIRSRKQPRHRAGRTRAVSRLRALLRGHAAVQRKDRTGGEAAFVAGEKQDAGRDLLRGAETTEELARRERLARGAWIGALPEDVVEIRCVDGSGRDRVAADAVADVIDGNG